MLIDYFDWLKVIDYLSKDNNGNCIVVDGAPKEIIDKIRSYNIRMLISKGRKMVENVDLRKLHNDLDIDKEYTFEQFVELLEVLKRRYQEK